METNNYIKVLGVFLVGWTLSGFGLSQILDVIKTDQVTTESTTGVPLTMTLSLVNASDNLPVTSGFRVELSQCSMQRPYGANAYACQPIKDEAKNTIYNIANKQSQFTNSDGTVTFSTGYPDKYIAPTTHFHISVYDRFNTLVVSSQFDFPSIVYPTMSAYYQAGGKNPSDLLIEDPTANPPLVVTGNATAGFRATRTLFIPDNASGAALTDVGDYGQVSELKNFPNPVINATTFAFHLTQTSEVAITVTDASGTQVKTVFADNLTEGAHEIQVDLGGLQKGIYFYRLEVSNRNGTFSKAKKLIKV